MEKIRRILIADDHTIVREALRALLSLNPSLEVVGEAGDGQEAVQLAQLLMPDLILMDLSMPKISGTDAIKEIKAQVPQTKVLVLTMHKTEEHLWASLRSGADGFIPKDAHSSELEFAIESILNGRPYLSPEISGSLVEGYLEGKRGFGTRWETLTHRERGIVKLIAEGHTSKQIAELLHISIKTVEKHRSNIRKKLHMNHISELIAFALEEGLVEAPSR